MPSSWRFSLPIAAAAALVAACGGSDHGLQSAAPGATAFSATGPVAAAPMPAEIVVTTIASGLDRPWSLSFLPDGSMLVSERAGTLRIVAADGTVSAPVPGVPRVAAHGQGGLLDVRPGPDFAEDATLWFTFAEQVDDSRSRAAVASARLVDGALTDVQVVFRQHPALPGGNHYGSRIAFAADGTLFVTLGDRYRPELAQALDNHVGKVLRIRPDGSAPEDNPFVGVDGVLPEIWSYGHRNPQGAAIEPGTATLWTSEHGPYAGDEVNVPVPGGNHGWPLVSYGQREGVATLVGDESRPGLEPARFHWTEPGLAPSGMSFYTGTAVPAWQGDLFVGALAGRALVRLSIEEGRVVAEERLLSDLRERIRDVQTGPDGHLYLLTDSADGRILRLDVP
jgi:aldose sugar dehydrogenase